MKKIFKTSHSTTQTFTFQGHNICSVKKTTSGVFSTAEEKNSNELIFLPPEYLIFFQKAAQNAGLNSQVKEFFVAQMAKFRKNFPEEINTKLSSFEEKLDFAGAKAFLESLTYATFEVNMDETESSTNLHP